MQKTQNRKSIAQSCWSRMVPAFISLFFCPIAASALTLQEGLAIISEKGRDVAVAQAEQEAARSNISLARSHWFPTVDIYARETWLKDQPAVKTPSGSFPTSQDNFLTYGMKVTQTLYDFGKTSSSVDSAKATLKSREAATLQAKNRAAIEFISAYFDLLEAEELLKVAAEEAASYEAHRKDAEARLKAGAATKHELLQAEVLLSDSKQRLLTAENNRALCASKINSILLRPLTAEVHASEITGFRLEAITLEEAWESAEKNNPALMEIDSRIAAKSEAIQSVRSEYLPTIYLSGGYEYNENQYQVHEDNWTVIAGININLFSGGATSAKAAAAASERLALRIYREKVLDAIKLEVQSAFLELESSKRKIDVAMTAVAQAEENLRLQRLRYQEGVGISTDVQDAVAMMTAAETNAWKAAYSLKRAEAALLYAMGKDLIAAYGAAK